MSDYIELNGVRYEFGCKGYLKDMTRWDGQVRDWFAGQEGIDLSGEHHEIIKYLRNYYYKHQEHPELRTIAAAMGGILGPDKGNPKYFHVLFPAGLQQADKIAGLPMRHSCC